jgi:hypothetical protein
MKKRSPSEKHGTEDPRRTLNEMAFVLQDYVSLEICIPLR